MQIKIIYAWELRSPRDKSENLSIYFDIFVTSLWEQIFWMYSTVRVVVGTRTVWRGFHREIWRVDGLRATFADSLPTMMLQIFHFSVITPRLDTVATVLTKCKLFWRWVYRYACIRSCVMMHGNEQSARDLAPAVQRNVCNCFECELHPIVNLT